MALRKGGPSARVHAAVKACAHEPVLIHDEDSMAFCVQRKLGGLRSARLRRIVAEAVRKAVITQARARYRRARR